MKPIKIIFILLIASGNLHSCLVPSSPRNHYFMATDATGSSDPKMMIFSTPRYKSYVVTDIDSNAQVFIKSPAFANPGEFYLMKNEKFFETEAKQYQLSKTDHRFYKTSNYKNITLKLIKEGNEKIINYKIKDK